MIIGGINCVSSVMVLDIGNWGVGAVIMGNRWKVLGHGLGYVCVEWVNKCRVWGVI